MCDLSRLAAFRLTPSRARARAIISAVLGALLSSAMGSIAPSAFATPAHQDQQKNQRKEVSDRQDAAGNQDIAPAHARGEASEGKLRAQSLGRKETGVFINEIVQNAGFSPDFVMRGFPTGVTLFEGAAHGFSAQDVDLSTIDHVEFFKGPTAMLFGRALGGYGGAANYIRKSPEDDPFQEISATVGSFDARKILFDVNRPLNDSKSLLFRMTGAAQSAGSFVDFVRSRSYDVMPVFTYIADNGDRLTFRTEHNNARFVFRDGFPADPVFLRVRRSFYAGAPVNERETNQFDEFTAYYDHAFNNNWSATAVVSYYLTRTSFGWFQDWGFDGVRSLTLGQPVRTRNATRSFDAQFRLNGHFDTGSIKHAVFLGLEHWDYWFGYSNIFSRSDLAPIDIFFPVYPVGVNYIDPLWSNGVARAWSNSVYGQDLIDLTPQLRILLGGRYDLLAQRERVFDPFGALSGETTISLSKGRNGYFSPRAGILWRPFEKTELFGGFGKSLIPNTGVRLLGGQAPPPQQDTQYEIGFRQQFWDDRMIFELGLFDVTRDNVAIPNPLNPSGFYSIVTGQQHSHGVEVNLNGDVTDNLNVTASATFLHALVTKDSNPDSQLGSDLLGAPRRVYNIGGTYTFHEGALKDVAFGMSYYYASRAQATIPNIYGFTLPPQHMLGANLSYSFTPDTKLEINATNLTDNANFTSSGALMYGEPRAVSVTLTHKF